MMRWHVPKDEFRMSHEISDSFQQASRFEDEGWKLNFGEIHAYADYCVNDRFRRDKNGQRRKVGERRGGIKKGVSM